MGGSATPRTFFAFAIACPPTVPRISISHDEVQWTQASALCHILRSLVIVLIIVGGCE